MINLHGVKSRLKELISHDNLPSGNEIPSYQTLKAFNERYTFSSLLAYERFDENDQIYFNKDTVGIMLHCPPSTGLVNENIAVLNGIFKGIYPPDTTIQINIISDSNIEYIVRNWAIEGTDPTVNNAEMYQYLALSRYQHLVKAKWDPLVPDQPFVLRNMHLVISISHPYPKGYTPSNFDDFKSEIDRIKRSRDSLISKLASAQIPAKVMEPQHFINILNGFLNPDKEEQPILEYSEYKPISDQIISSETVFLPEQSGITVVHKDQKYSLLPYHVRTFPTHWKGVRNGELVGAYKDNILRLGCPFILSLSVIIPDQSRSKAQAVAKQVRATQMADSPMAKFMPSWKDKKRDWDYTVKSLEDGNKLVESCFQILLLTKQGEEQKNEETLRSLYSSIGWTINKSRYTPVHSVLNALPMGATRDVQKGLQMFKYYTPMLSQNCTNLAPFVGEWKGYPNSLMLMMGRRGQLAYFDQFANKKGNYNVACCATSGSGKSFVTQENITNTLRKGGRAFVIDAGHSYKNICNLLGGTYIDFGDYRRQLCLNPFSNIKDEYLVIDGEKTEKTHFEEQLPMLKQLVMQMATGATALSKQEETQIEIAITTTWESKKSDSEVNDVYEVLQKSSDPIAKNLAMALYPYSRNGMYGKYVNGKSNVDYTNNLVVLDLDALNVMKDLQVVVLLMLMMQITQIMYLAGDKKRRKLCIIDEAWRLMDSGENGTVSHAAKSIEEGYRVARKHGGSFMTLTQKISDYFKSETSKAALMNADFTIYLRQKPAELEQAIKQKHINDASGIVDVLKTLETKQGQYSEMAIESPEGLSVFRLVVDPITEKLYSTSPDEVQFIQEKKSEGFTLLESVQLLLDQQQQAA
ncbi:type IV secretion system protein TraC [Acinetobacter baumannii]|uniref:type IV secretion system protein TraC n=1 Tax=Acinetobacter baumannii TaxID=470 RepID=UPI00385FD74E